MPTSARPAGTSPRVWGKHWIRLLIIRPPRNIPTRVGKTAAIERSSRRRPEHPHACGENGGYRGGEYSFSGTSPRVWGKRSGRAGSLLYSRNIPTRVGKTNEQGSLLSQEPEHPHACGENSVSVVIMVSARRNIPTRVGKTQARCPVVFQTPEHPHACGENELR